MPLSPVNKRYTASVRGLITEGNEITPIEHSNLAESNYELLHDGTRRRRRPVLQEKANPSEYRSVERGNAISSYLWSTPAREENVSIVVEETEGEIRFFWLEHESLTYISDDLMIDQVRLELWGRYQADGRFGGDNPAFRFDSPCTYTEGNGSLYIFNKYTGTIKVDLISRDEKRLRFTPIGTWVRDYEGADEFLDHEFRTPHQGLTGYNGVAPYPEFEDFIQEDLNNVTAYNLSNMGWPGKDIGAFVDQSDEAYTIQLPFGHPPITRPTRPKEYPAFLDRYLDGRTISDDGVDVFSYARLEEAPTRHGEPTKGARIMHSDYAHAGTLQPVPVKASVSGSPITPLNDFVFVNVQLDKPLTHSAGRTTDEMAMFVHYIVFEADASDGSGTYVGGMSGMFDVNAVSADGKTVTFQLESGAFADYSQVRVQAMYYHPSPVYTPHRIPTNLNTSHYDYRNDRRPAAGAFYAGRLWQFSDEHNRLYFSQQIPESTHGREDYDIQRESLCYMEHSPTDGDDSMMVATDGGYVVISDSGTHLQGEVLLGSLIISTDNGIWEIKGTDRSGVFRPDGFGVRRLTQSEVLGHKAMVNLGTEMHVAADEGIVRIFPDERTGVLKTEVMTHTTIKTEYDELVDEDRDVVGAYDPDSRTVRWAFPLSGEYTSTSSTSACPMLSYAMQHNAWYRYDFGFGGAIADMIVLPYTVKNPTYNRFRYLVVSLNLTGIPAPLLAEWAIEAEIGPMGPNEWVEFHDPDALFADFMDVFLDPQERVAPEAFMLTNHYLYGEGQRWEQINYVTAYNREVTTHWIGRDDLADGDAYMSYDENIRGSTLLQAQWDWFNGDGRGKHTAPQETFRYRRSYFANDMSANPEQDRREALIVAKQKVRGRGREFRLRWSSNDHFDSHIVGWSIEGLVLSTI